MVAAAVAVGVPSAPAAAEGLFAYVFRGFRAPPPPPPLRLDSPEEFFRLLLDKDRRQGSIRSSGGVYSGFCVRLCDGAYFPIRAHRNMSAAAQCRSFCPSSETGIFSGAGIEGAVAGNGRRYADLPNAFVYRTRIVAGCTCSGGTTAGVAHVPLADDPTLRPGDIVATNAGLTVYRGKGPGQQAAFTPIESANISSSLRNRLADVKVTPRLPAATTGAATTGTTTTGAAPADPDQTSSIGSDLPRVSARLP
jgi:hypothetical protein